MPLFCSTFGAAAAVLRLMSRHGKEATPAAAPFSRTRNQRRMPPVRFLPRARLSATVEEANRPLAVSFRRKRRLLFLALLFIRSRAEGRMPCSLAPMPATTPHGTS
jgi:hypothetical protein